MHIAINLLNIPVCYASVNPSSLKHICFTRLPSSKPLFSRQLLWRFAVAIKCGGRKQHKGRKPDCNFMEPEGADSTRSSYRLLCAVAPYFYVSIYFP